MKEFFEVITTIAMDIGLTMISVIIALYLVKFATKKEEN
jgi:hypothetical protein